ncbi:MAG: hypothetical protein A2Y17_01350 [Clostridiales bacterium GWF2_38_85]|nr:MAG: hypothetical protein A2Y17_01350 [Clostridiales bacterium GWF2_38_85]HBL85166.1 hypothetical protein [Clostridiales bacterium]
MEFLTASKEQCPHKIVEIKCIQKDNLNDIEIKDKCFLLLIITEGCAVFRLGNKQIIAEAPCFVCFDERFNPTILKKRKLKCKSVYFHPRFLNINMTFEFIRSQSFSSIAEIHDMFLLTPFTGENHVIPIIPTYKEKIDHCFEHMVGSLEDQPNWYWSCHTRSYFFELMLAIERINQMITSGNYKMVESDNTKISDDRVKSAIQFIESHYSKDITTEDVLAVARTNHTTLADIFRKEVGRTPAEYIKFYRIKLAKKQLAFTDVPIKGIALMVGFKTDAHFSRIFKQLTGISPLEYRIEAVKNRKEEFIILKKGAR